MVMPQKLPQRRRSREAQRRTQFAALRERRLDRVCEDEGVDERVVRTLT